MNNNQIAITDFENAYVSLEMYLRRITGLPNHVGVVGLFQRILPHQYYVQMQTIREYKNLFKSHGFKVNGKVPVPPPEYARFLKMELHWAMKNSAQVKQEILKIYNGNNSHRKPSKTRGASNGAKNKYANKKRPCAITVPLIIQCVMLGIYSLTVGLSGASVEHFAFKSIVLGGSTVGIFLACTLIINLMNGGLTSKLYKSGTFMLLAAILINTVLLITLKDNYAFNFPFTFLVIGVYGIICAKLSFDKFKSAFGIFNIIEVILSLIGFIFGFIFLLNGDITDWEILQWTVALFLCTMLAVIGFLVWLLSENLHGFSEAICGGVLLGIMIIANFILSCIFKEDYQCIFYCLTIGFVLYGIVLAKHATDKLFKSQRKIILLHISEIIVALATAILSI